MGFIISMPRRKGITNKMTLKEYLKLNKPDCINVLMATNKVGKTISVMYDRKEYSDNEVMSKELLKCDVDEVRDEDGYVAIWVVQRRG